MKMTLSRMCVITRVKKQRHELVKITKVNNNWFLDEDQKLFGRSIYIDLNEHTLFKFSKQQKRFKMTDEEFQTILNGLKIIDAS